MKLSIIIPAHNEEHRLPAMLEAYAAYFLEKPDGQVEIIIVVNNTTDNTVAVASEISKQYSAIKIIDEPRNVGKGGAVMLGAEVAMGEYIGFVDADGATAPDAFNALYEAREQAPVLIASRWMTDSVVEPAQPLRRRISSRCFNFLVTLFFQFKISDTQCGAKLVQGGAMKEVLPLLGETRWAFDIDLLYKLHMLNYDITEIPTVWENKEGSKIRYFRSSVEMLLAIVRLRLLHSPFRFFVILINRIARWFR